MCTAIEDMLIGYNEDKKIWHWKRKIESRFHLIKIIKIIKILNELEIFVNEDVYQLLWVRNALLKQKSEGVS